MIVTALYYQQTTLPTGTNPPGLTDVNTHCFIGLVPHLKPFQEVLIKWNGTKWVEQSSYSTGSIPVLKVFNPCGGWYDYIGYPFNDFKAAGCCAVPDPGGE